MSIFGSIVTDDQVEDALLEILRKWTPTYLAEVERQVGVDEGYYERPWESSYISHTDFDAFPEDARPLVAVVSDSPGDEPAAEGSGVYRAHFQMSVYSVAVGPDQEFARRFAYRLGAATRAAVIQHQSLDSAISGRVRGVTWIAGGNNELDSADDRTIWAVRDVFAVEVGDILNKRGGPAAPDADPQLDPLAPWPDHPEATEVTATPELELIT